MPQPVAILNGLGGKFFAHTQGERRPARHLRAGQRAHAPDQGRQRRQLLHFRGHYAGGRGGRHGGVIALEGDGSILMSLGCLSTIAMVKPRNLTVIIIDNGIYQITGKQPTSAQATADIVAIARASGIAGSFWIRDEAHFDELIDRAVADGGPTLLAARIDDQSAVTQTVRDPALIRNRFMKGLGTGRGGALDN